MDDRTVASKHPPLAGRADPSRTSGQGTLRVSKGKVYRDDSIAYGYSASIPQRERGLIEVPRWECGFETFPSRLPDANPGSDLALRRGHTLTSNNLRRTSRRYNMRVALPRMQNMITPHLVTDPEILGGSPVFAGTRVPIRILFEHLEAGDSLAVFLEDFPSVSREIAVAVLEEARAALTPDAHPA